MQIDAELRRQPKLWRKTRIVLILVLVGLLSACSLPEGVGSLRNLEIDSPLFSVNIEQTTSPEIAAPETGEHLDVVLDEQDEEILIIEEIIIGMLLIAVLVGIAAHRLRVPYTVGLVLIGLVLTLQSGTEVSISPNLILALLVPPLIFEAAFHLNINELRNNLAPILALAIPGVVLTTLVVGLIVSWGTGLGLLVALVFGALVSATDPVSVVALFRSIGAPKRLQVLLEGESLFNDGTAIILFDLVVVLAVSGASSFNIADTLVDFVRISGGGLVVGLVMGVIVSQIISRIDDYLIETTLTSVLAFGAYLVADHLLGVSGVLAVVAAGLTNGNIGPRGMSPTTRIVVFNFWEYAAFVANSFIFLLIGLRIDLPVIFENWLLIAWAIGAILVARAAGVYILSRVGSDIPLRWQHVLYWGGLRGAISLALALSLPAELENIEQIQVMAFGVVLFTLLVQGFSMGPLVRRLGLIERSPMQDEYERRHARAVASRAAFEHLERRNRQGLLSDHSWRSLGPLLREHNTLLAESVREVLAADPSVEAEELDTAHREALRAQRSALTALMRDGIISDDTYNQLVTEVDAALTEKSIGWPELLGTNRTHYASIDRLLAVIIHEDDLESAMSALSKLGFSVTKLPSSGGFLKRRNATLLLGLAEMHLESAVRALQLSCRQRVEYLSSIIEGMPQHITPTTPITVGGATIFTFEIERFEVF